MSQQIEAAGLMNATNKLLKKELETLNNEQLEQVAQYISFLKFRARFHQWPAFQKEHGRLYEEFAAEDQQLAEEGMDDFTEMLKKEDAKY